jgi:hypothetical protein
LFLVIHEPSLNPKSERYSLVNDLGQSEDRENVS